MASKTQLSPSPAEMSPIRPDRSRTDESAEVEALLMRLEGEPQLGPLASRILELLEPRVDEHRPTRLAVRSERGGLLFLDLEEVEWIDAAGKHCRVNAAGERYLLRESIGTVEERLGPDRFFRIHRSTLVNLEYVREIRPRDHGNHIVLLESDVRLNLARGAKSELVEALLARPSHKGS